MRTLLRLGILQADAVLTEFQPAFGDYPDMFERLLMGAAAARSDGLELELHTYAVHEGELPGSVDACDGWLITGSRHSVYDDLPWIGELAAFVRKVVETGGKVVGICFGHQLLAHFFEGETGPAEAGWAVGVHEVDITERESWMLPFRADVGLLSSHKDQVTRLPAGARPIARSDFCPLSGFVIGKQVFTLQGHPEFSKPYSAALMGKRRELLGEQTYAAGVEARERETHGPVIGSWILNFLLEDAARD